MRWSYQPDTYLEVKFLAYAQAVETYDYVGVFGLTVAMEEPVLALLSPQVPSAQLIITPRGMEAPHADFGIDFGDGAAVDVAHERARAMGMRIVYPLTNESWGVRRFFVEDPDGRIVNVLAHL